MAPGRCLTNGAGSDSRVRDSGNEMRLLRIGYAIA
jgi:hypothetical protein